MTVPFVGGPYDGMSLSAFEIQQIASLTLILTKRGLRKFGIFPHPDTLSLDALGELMDGVHHKSYMYELVNASTGPQHQYDPDHKRYHEALKEAI